MTAYTPGPWFWESHSLRPIWRRPHSRADSSAVQTILELDNKGIGYVGADPQTVIAELMADHHLIAAAPLMFEALLVARKALAHALAQGHGDGARGLRTLRALDLTITMAQFGQTP